MGVTAAFAALQKLRLVEGRFISDLDFRRYYCVLGDTLAQAMRRAGAEPIVGQRIKANGLVYTVTGVMARAAPRPNMNLNRVLLVPITTAQRVFKDGRIRDITARMSPDVHYTTVERDVTAYFRGKSRNMRITVESAQQLIEHIQEQLQLITLLLGAVGGIALIIGGANVMNVMLASVSERRKEIGIRRALGARRRDIQGQFLIEAVTLSLLGSALGILVGVGGTYALCQYTGWTFAMFPEAMALGVGVASGVGIAFGFYPAWLAARLDPITAMRAL